MKPVAHEILDAVSIQARRALHLVRFDAVKRAMDPLRLKMVRITDPMRNQIGQRWRAEGIGWLV